MYMNLKNFQGIAPTKIRNSVLRAFGMKVGHIFYVITSIHEYRSKAIEKDANKNDLMELRALFVRIHLASFCSIIR